MPIPEAEPPAEPLFFEGGGQWRSVAYPALWCTAGGILELLTGQLHLWLWLGAAAVLCGFKALSVLAMREHKSVELTASELREGTELLALSEIAQIYPELDPQRAHDDPQQPWELARALGGSPTVPGRCEGVGLRLVDGRLVQAWARDTDRFRDQLEAATAAVATAAPRPDHSGQ